MMRHVQLKHGTATVSKAIKPETLNALDEMMAAAAKQMQIKESPILFSGPMIVAILTCKKCGHISEPFPCAKCGSEEFVKSQTRRVTKKQPSEPLYLQKLYGKSPDGFAFGERGLWTVAGPDYPDAEPDQFRCPYSAEGDRLWVRETHGIFGVSPSGVHVGYKARLRAGKTLADTDGGLSIIRVGETEQQWALANLDSERWRPSIFLPRWASRISLEIISVKAERLQEISTADIEAEGISLPSTELYPEINRDYKLRLRWQLGWDKINGKRNGGRYRWSANPFVFRISFRRIRPNN